MSYFHIPVLLKEVIDAVDPEPGENIIDGTVGGGSHAETFLEQTFPDGKLLGIDLDEEAIIESKRKLGKYSERAIIKKGNFVDFEYLMKECGFRSFNIFFLDLGISSQQLNNEKIGISFLVKAPLDMRIGGYSSENNGRITAERIVNDWKEEEIEAILKNYGEERYGKNIARGIARERKIKRIVNTRQLVDIISKATPAGYKRQRIHFATKTFQALRIAVNKDLSNLENVLPRILEKIETGGRIAIISFHSLEDRIVKNFFQRESRDCVCEPETPVCVCEHKKKLEIITKKPIAPGEEEIARNPRSRSAKLRVARKIKVHKV